MKSRNRTRLINLWKIAKISVKVACGIWIIWSIFLIGYMEFSLFIEATNVTMSDYALCVFAALFVSTYTTMLYVGIPLSIIELVCVLLMEFFKKKIRLKENVFTEIKLKNRKKSSIEEKMILTLFYSKDVIMLARPEGDKVLIKCIKGEKEIVSVIVYEDDFYYSDVIEYNC